MRRLFRRSGLDETLYQLQPLSKSISDRALDFMTSSPVWLQDCSSGSLSQEAAREICPDSESLDACYAAKGA